MNTGLCCLTPNPEEATKPSTDPIFSQLTKEEVLTYSLEVLNTILPHLRAEVTDSLCWSRHLHNQLIAAREEYTHLCELQTAIIIRQAELQGKVKVLPPARASVITSGIARKQAMKDAQATGASDVTIDKAKKLILNMSPEEKEALLAQFSAMFDLPTDPLSKE